MSSIITVNHAANIDRIIAILQANTSLWNPANPKDKLRKIWFAETDYDMRDDMTPFATVQWDDQYQSTREPYGTQNNQFLQTEVAYNISIVVQKKDISETTREISRLLDLVVSQLKAFPTLADPLSIGTPLAVRTNLKSIGRLETQKGMSKDGAVIKLVCQIGSAWTMQFPAPIGTLNVLSTPIYDDDMNTDVDLVDDMTQVITGKEEPSKITVEVESNDTIDNQLKTMKTTGANITIVLSYGSVFSRTRTAVLTGFHKPVPYDNIERTVITCDTIQ